MRRDFITTINNLLKINGVPEVGLQGAKELPIERALFHVLPDVNVNHNGEGWFDNETIKNVTFVDYEVPDALIIEIAFLNSTVIAAAPAILRPYVANAPLITFLFGGLDNSLYSEVLISVEKGLRERVVSQEILDLYTPDNLANTLLLIASAKINFWLTNHHQASSTGSISGLLYKVLGILGIPVPDATTNDYTQFVRYLRQIVHPYSSRNMICQLFGMNVQPFFFVHPSVCVKPIIQGDEFIKLRTSNHNFPAGTRRFALMREMIRQLALSGALPFFPYLDKIDTILSTCEKIERNPSAFHTGGSYFHAFKLGERNELVKGFSNSAFGEVFSALATFMLVVMPNNSICESPNIDNNREQFLEVNIDFRNILTTYLSHKRSSLESTLIAIIANIDNVSVKELNDYALVYTTATTEEEKEVAKNEIIVKVKELNRQVLNKVNNSYI